MSRDAYELAALTARYIFAALMLWIVWRACRGVVVDSRRAARLRRLSPMTGLCGEMVVLVGDERARRGMRYPVIREGTIGSSRGADIRIRHSSVRRRHAYFQLFEDGLHLRGHAGARLRDGGGRPVSEMVLMDGDAVSIGSIKLLLVLSVPEEVRGRRREVPRSEGDWDDPFDVPMDERWSGEPRRNRVSETAYRPSETASHAPYDGTTYRPVNHPGDTAPRPSYGEPLHRPAEHPSESAPRAPYGETTYRPANRPSESASRTPYGETTYRPAERSGESASRTPYGETSHRPANRPSETASRVPYDGTTTYRPAERANGTVPRSPYDGKTTYRPTEHSSEPPTRPPFGETISPRAAEQPEMFDGEDYFHDGDWSDFEFEDQGSLDSWDEPDAALYGGSRSKRGAHRDDSL